jgi:hypothetical protein
MINEHNDVVNVIIVGDEVCADPRTGQNKSESPFADFSLYFLGQLAFYFELAHDREIRV